MALPWLSRWFGTDDSAGSDASPDPESQLAACIGEEIVPALEAVRDRLAGEGFDARLAHGDDWAELRVRNFNGLDLKYAARGHIYKEAVLNLASLKNGESLKRFLRIEIERGGRKREYRPGRCRRDAVEKAATRYYRRFLMKSPGG